MDSRTSANHRLVMLVLQKTEIDINVKIYYMSAGEINRNALREIHPSNLGCFIRKPLTNDDLIGRVVVELDRYDRLG
jgi:hypothetical protein